MSVPGSSGPAVGSPKPKPPDRPAQKAPTKPQQAVKSPSQQWYMQTEDGEQYGPVPWEELAGWAAEGRIDASCQFLQEGWSQWKWAEEVFPELTETAQQPAQQNDENPLAGLIDTTLSGQGADTLQPPQADRRTDADQRTDRGGITRGARRALQQTKPWVTFLAILGFISGGLGALGGSVVFVLMAMADGGRGAVIGLMAFVGPAIAILLSYYLFSYGQRIYVFLRSDKPADLEAALAAQRSYWKLAGIVTAVMLAFYLLMAALVFALAQ